MAQPHQALQVDLEQAGDYVNPYEDVSNWWSFFFKGGFSWRWSETPHLYFRPNLEYVPQQRFAVVDGLGRKEVYEKPFDCYIDPLTGKIETLYVQTTDSICRLSQTAPNCTWNRTCIRNVSPISLRVANLPFRFIPSERRHDKSKYTGEDWAIVVAMWVPTLICFLLALFTLESVPPEGKNQEKYLPLLYSGLRYPRLARNLLENRQDVARQLSNHPAWNSAAMGTYRTFRPRFLNYLVKRKKNGGGTYKYERRAVTSDDMVSYVVIAYSSAHFQIPQDPHGGHESGDLERLFAIATKAAVRYFEPMPGDLQKQPRAFWLAENCIPPGEVADDNGSVRSINDSTKKADLANQDTYSISDIIRGAKHVIIIAGNHSQPWDDNALQVWGQRVWTLPEVVLSQGDYITVVECGMREGQSPVNIREIPKTLFPSYAWKDDALSSRQLIEHYSNLRLSRLELVKIALDCLMSRRLRSLHPGDRVYALMGLLRIRPPIDMKDSSFQAFGRLSLPQDSDRLMERLICLLPDTPEQNWELMTDQYKASLWDIYPETQVCGIGENDTVVVDGAKAAQIQWSGFHQVRTLRRPTTKRSLLLKFITWSPSLLIGSVVLAATVRPAGVIILVLVIFLLILPAPYYIWHIHAGKLWEVEPCLFGIEGYVPLEAIEAKLFGMHSNRMRWSAWGSPLSRHRQGEAIRERTISSTRDDNDENPPPVQPLVGEIDTYPVETIDPCNQCPECVGNGGRYCRFHPTPAFCQDRSRSCMGQTKVFTLVDTFNMTATLFDAVRPPTVLVIGGSEGGMKRAIACSFDITTGTLYRETVLRIPSPSADRMESLPRIRLGLRPQFLDTDVRRSHPAGYEPAPPSVPRSRFRTARSERPVQSIHASTNRTYSPFNIVGRIIDLL